jgi:hypothetical protein
MSDFEIDDADLEEAIQEVVKMDERCFSASGRMDTRPIMYSEFD